MTQTLDAAISYINSAQRPVSFTEIVNHLNINTVEQDSILKHLRESDVIFSHSYKEDDESIDLFWRKDLRNKHAETAFLQWEKQSAIV